MLLVQALNNILKYVSFIFPGTRCVFLACCIVFRLHAIARCFDMAARGWRRLALLHMLTILSTALIFFRQMDPENKPTREELKEEVLKVSKGLASLGGFNLVSKDVPTQQGSVW